MKLWPQAHLTPPCFFFPCLTHFCPPLSAPPSFGNMYYVREKGEGAAVLNLMDALSSCLHKGGCNVVPGLIPDQVRRMTGPKALRRCPSPCLWDWGNAHMHLLPKPHRRSSGSASGAP